MPIQQESSPGEDEMFLSFKKLRVDYLGVSFIRMCKVEEMVLQYIIYACRGGHELIHCKYFGHR